MRINRVLFLFIILSLSPLYSLRAEQISGTDNDGKLPFWEWRNEYMSLRLVQRLPDQTRAYFAGRGFSSEDVKTIAGYCVFQTVYTNKSSADNKLVIQHDIRDWKYQSNGSVYRMKPREDWKLFWQEKNVAQAQIVAFEWSLLPSRQIFEAGDYNWGMTVFEVAHGTRFDLDISWKVNGTRQTARLKNITCAKDIYIPPQ